MIALANQICMMTPDVRLQSRSDGLWLDAPDLDVTALARLMLDAQAHLSTITAVVIPGGETELIYHYRQGSDALNIKTRTHQNVIDSITPITPAAGWIEREIHDLYAVTFSGHPNLARLVRPPEMPAGFFRGDAGGAGSKSGE